jgi:hypothetical protein
LFKGSNGSISEHRVEKVLGIRFHLNGAWD